MTTHLDHPLPAGSVLTHLMEAVRTSGTEVQTHRRTRDTVPGPHSPQISGRRPVGGQTVVDAGAPWTVPASDLLARRRSLRFFDSRPIPAGCLTAAIRDACTADAELWSPAGVAGSDVAPLVVALRVTGLAAGIYSFDPVTCTYTGLAEIDADAVADMVLQAEYADAAAIVAAVGSLQLATGSHGDHGQRLLTVRGAGLCYATYLQACARGLTGSVFAGFLLSGLSRLLVIDGYHQSQVFAVALGHQVEPTHFPAGLPGGKTPPDRRSGPGAKGQPTTDRRKES